MPSILDTIKKHKSGDPPLYLPTANLQGANLQGAYLGGADLRWADLQGAKLDDTTVIDTGETWGQYLKEVVPVMQAMLAFSTEISLFARPRYEQYLRFKEIIAASIPLTNSIQ